MSDREEEDEEEEDEDEEDEDEEDEEDEEDGVAVAQRQCPWQYRYNKMPIEAAICIAPKKNVRVELWKSCKPKLLSMDLHVKLLAFMAMPNQMLAGNAG